MTSIGLNQQSVKRYEWSIYQSLVIDSDPTATIVKLRQQIADGVGSVEWREALRLAITKFEALR